MLCQIYVDDSHINFHQRLRKTLYYGQYADGSLPSPIVTDVAVRLINSKTSGKKSLDKHQATRITRRARISPCALMMGILYTERLAQSNPSYLKKVSSSDLFMVSMLVASKYLYDDGEDEDAYNYDWCKAGNYHIRDLNRLEREFLSSIEWRIFVSCKEFFDFVNRVETRVALDQGQERGWYSYLDMNTLLENLMFRHFLTKYLKSTGKTILSCTVAYSLSVALLFSASACFLAKDHHSRQNSRAFFSPRSESSTSFMPKIGHSEYSLKISQTVRKRRTRLPGNELNSKQDNFNALKPNQTNHTKGDICDQCGSTMMTWGSKGSFMADRFSSKFPGCVLGSRYCDLSLNDTSYDDELLASGFIRVLSFMKLPFHNRSWFYGSVRFPIWENAYSDILIGFSTSTAAAA
ncbi:protein CNPPD1-like isoform X2 [Dendronephthya gigantea]|uniref:protein CNPPD1-like isoform X2 n=1 Tax=Dendronephthya gigantea TaxID=151771 RepID=UPI00106AEE00|nr:protein CNPPD1-like isoform X2 [Dendronephthya gigantea]